MKQDHRYQLGIVLIAAVVMLTGLHATKLWDEDEGYFASTAAEMYADGNWVVPTFNGSLFGHKPPWMYWMMMMGFYLFGTTEFAARFFSAIFGVATCLLTYHLGKRLFCAQIGWWAGLVMASCIMFNVVSRAATPDTYLTFFVALSLYLFAIYGPFSRISETSSLAENQTAHRVLPPRWHQFAMIYAVMGIATLVKGPIGFLFPMAVIGLFLMCMTPRRPLPPEASRWRRWHEIIRPFGPTNFFRLLWRMRIFTAIAMTLLIAGPWYLAVGIKTEGAFFYEFFGVHHYQRFTSPMENHSGPIIYYPLSILIGMFPWSIFTLPTVLLVIRQLRKGGAQNTALVLMTCWVLIYVGIFSLASTKLPNYILPAYPALAILAAYYFRYWIDNPMGIHPLLRRIGVGSLPVVALFGLVGLPLAGIWKWQGQTLLDRVGLAPEIQSHLIWVGLVGIPLLIGGTITVVFAERRQSSAAMTSLAWTSVITMICVWNFAAPQVGQYQTNALVGQSVRAATFTNRSAIAQFGYFPPSLSFYIRQPVSPLFNQDQASQFLTDSGARLLVTTTDKYDSMKDNLNNSVEIVGRVNRFPKPGEIIILQTKAAKY